MERFPLIYYFYLTTKVPFDCPPKLKMYVNTYLICVPSMALIRKMIRLGQRLQTLR